MAAMRNPGELLVFGNPKARGKRAPKKAKRAKLRVVKRRNAGGFGNHKPGCKCAFCDRAGKLQRGEIKPPPLPHHKKNSGKLEKQREARERAERIRKARQNPKRSTSRRRRGDRNPDDMSEAVQLFASFHGRDPKEIADKHVSAAVRLEYAALGDLEYLKAKTPIGDTVKFEFDSDGVKLASSPDGKQLYCIGGNQNIAPLLDAASLEKDFIDLGECLEVQYLARKIHGDFRPVSYYHKFGEDTGVMPQLMFDKLKRQIFFVGGEYFINAKQGVSPGIEN